MTTVHRHGGLTKAVPAGGRRNLSGAVGRPILSSHQKAPAKMSPMTASTAWPSAVPKGLRYERLSTTNPTAKNKVEPTTTFVDVRILARPASIRSCIAA